MKNNNYLLSLVTLLVLSACGAPAASTPVRAPTIIVSGNQAITLTSPAFKQGEAIPAVYTCNGSDTSPALEWGEPPNGTQSFALISDDPDAPSGVFNHWVIYNIPPTTRSLPESLVKDAKLPDGTQQGQNSRGWVGYLGPCPPNGTHHYTFVLYALDGKLELSSGANKGDLLAAMNGHILATGELIGTYHQ